MSINHKSQQGKTKSKRKPGRPLGSATGNYRRPAERGLGPQGGGWNIAQASAWSGIGQTSLRDMIRRKLAGEDLNVFPFYRLGRRTLIPREGFKAWFNRSQDPAT